MLFPNLAAPNPHHKSQLCYVRWNCRKLDDSKDERAHDSLHDVFDVYTDHFLAEFFDDCGADNFFRICMGYSSDVSSSTMFGFFLEPGMHMTNLA